MHLVSSANDAPVTGDLILPKWYGCIMRNSNTDDTSVQRIHFIEEWANRRGLTRAAIGRELGVDKSLVSRWFGGAIPSDKWLEPLAQLLGADDIGGLFRHPDDDWIAKLFRDKTEEQKEGAIQMLKLFFKNQISDAQPQQSSATDKR